MKQDKFPAVSIIGRPNVGKSTLFNRVIGRRMAVVHETSGTTRDSNEALYKKGSRSFRLIDTGGLLKRDSDRLSSMIRQQIEDAIKEADMLLFLCDAKTGITTEDQEIVKLLRKNKKQVILAVNKVDNKEMEDGVYDFYRLGLGEPYPVSAAHNRGIKSLIGEIIEGLSSLERSGKEEKAVYKIAITGRPNVGKSSFLNMLLNKERVIVDEKPGTTRDSIDTYFKVNDTVYLLIDTAGIRHKRKVKEAVDVYSMSRSKEAIERSDVSFLLIDGYDGLRNDDVRIFDFIVKSNKCCCVVVNKWDLVKNMQMAKYKNAMVRRTPSIDHYPIVFASAKTGRNILSSIDMVKYIVANSDQRFETKDLNKCLTQMKRLPAGRKSPKISYMVQTDIRPVTILLFINDCRLVTENFTNMVRSVLRKSFNLYGTPIRIEYKDKSPRGRKR